MQTRAVARTPKEMCGDEAKYKGHQYPRDHPVAMMQLLSFMATSGLPNIWLLGNRPPGTPLVVRNKLRNWRHRRPGNKAKYYGPVN